jgi:hypothetical protein
MFRTDVDVTQPNDVSADMALISLGTAPGGALFFNPAISAPPLGTCTMYSGSGRSLTVNLPNYASGLENNLDAGPAIAIAGTSHASLARGQAPFYKDYLGFSIPNAAASTLVLNTTQPTLLSAPGGADVGAFQSAVPPAVQLNWLNRLQTNTIDRTQPLTVTWSPTGLDNSTMAIAGSNYDLATNTIRSFICTASPAAGSFAVPSYILGALPASSGGVGKSYGVLGLAAVPANGLTTFTASGLDAGVAVQIFSSSKTVLFQ